MALATSVWYTHHEPHRSAVVLTPNGLDMAGSTWDLAMMHRLQGGDRLLAPVGQSQLQGSAMATVFHWLSRNLLIERTLMELFRVTSLIKTPVHLVASVDCSTDLICKLS